MTLHLTEVAVAVPLKVWQDPQGNVVLNASREDCAVYFGCWIEAGIPANYLCRLRFQNAWAVRGFSLGTPPYKIEEIDYRSRIYYVENSRLLKEAVQQRTRDYPQWLSWDRKTYRHYVVSGHDNYFDIIASEFTEEIIQRGEAGTLTYLIDQA